MTDAPAEDELDETAGGFLVCPVVLAALPYGSSPQEGAVSSINARPSGKLSSQIL